MNFPNQLGREDYLKEERRHHASPSLTTTFAGVCFESGTSGSAGFSENPFISTFFLIASVAASERSFAMTYLKGEGQTLSSSKTEDGADFTRGISLA